MSAARSGRSCSSTRRAPLRHGVAYRSFVRTEGPNESAGAIAARPSAPPAAPSPSLKKRRRVSGRRISSTSSLSRSTARPDALRGVRLDEHLGDDEPPSRRSTSAAAMQTHCEADQEPEQLGVVRKRSTRRRRRIRRRRGRRGRGARSRRFRPARSGAPGATMPDDSAPAVAAFRAGKQHECRDQLVARPTHAISFRSARQSADERGGGEEPGDEPFRHGPDAADRPAAAVVRMFRPFT